MREHSLVSVTMPVYNAEKYLKDSIESILNQTHKYFELIIVNDGSTDGSKEIILSFTDSRIRYFEHPVNQGLVKTRNKCMMEAKGDYIAILDSDDIALPFRLEKQVEFLDANPDYDICGTFYRIIDAEGVFRQKIDLPSSNADIKTFLYFGNCFCHSTVMLRRPLTKTLRYEQTCEYVEDYDLLYKIAKNSKVVNLPIYATLYRVHGKNTSIIKQRQMLAKLEQMNARILNELRIPFTQTELEMHSNFLRLNHDYFEHTTQINHLESWLLHICNKLKGDPHINEKLVAEIVVRRWVLICSKRHQYAKLFVSPIILRYKIVYWEYLIEKVREKFQKSKMDRALLFRML